MMTQLLSVGYDSDALYQEACEWAERLQLPVDNQRIPRLSVTSDKLVLLFPHFSPLFVDFNSLVLKKRHDAGKRQALVQACRPAKGVRILDATAGWGRDAAVLANFGAEVLMLERHPVMAALLFDGLRRALDRNSFRNGLSLLNVEAKEYLHSLLPGEFPDVIYIDPMHPERHKSALVKKDMQALQQMIGADHDAVDLIQLAIRRARQRVVVKWPERLTPLLPPSQTIHGKTVRFDVYLPS